MKIFKITIALCLLVVQTYAQHKITLQEAIETALQNNYSISIARNNGDISKTSNNYGTAGYLPSVTFIAGTSESSYNTKQEFSSGASVNRKQALSNNINSSIAMNWTVFDGFKMFATKEKLNKLQAQGALSLKIEIENTISKIIGAYYEIVRQQQLIKAAGESLKIYEERVKIAAKKLEIGSGSKIELLQAKVDLNSQKSALMKLNVALQTAIINLNQLLSKDANETYIVEDSIMVNQALDFNNLKNAVTTNNHQLQQAQHDITIADLQYKEIKSTTLPQVGVNLNYNLTRTKNEVGLILLNQNQGFNGGISASMNLFNGYKSSTQMKIATYNIQQQKIKQLQTNAMIDASLLKSWRTYQSAMEILKLEEENKSIALENVTIALERFRIGTSNSLELMTAQRSFEEANSRLVLARYEAKVAETELLRLEGQLVK